MFAGSPAVTAFARRPALPWRVAAKVFTFGNAVPRVLVNVVLLKLAEVYRAALPALAVETPFRKPTVIGRGEVPVPAPKKAKLPARAPPATLFAIRFACASL